MMQLTVQDILKLPVADLLQQFVADPETGWSMGAFGALGEFSRTIDEPVAINHSAETLQINTDKGGLRLNLPEQLKLFAYEMPMGRHNSWLHGVALCVPAEQAIMHQRKTITELDLDHQALLPDHAQHTLFDMGLQCPQADFCIRSDNPSVINTVQRYLGENLLTTANSLLLQMPELNPHRVVVSKLGRLEVYQDIPFPEEHTPDGPHTHVLPDLAKLRRTHNANIPIPTGLTPCATMHVAHPCQNTLGHEHAFNKCRHQQFQALLERFGDRELFQLKQTVESAVAKKLAPANLTMPLSTRAVRAVVKVTLRQLSHLNSPSESLANWQKHYDPSTA